MKLKLLFGLSLVVFCFLSWRFVDEKQQPDQKSLSLHMRDIGHQLLLQSGDSSSRVLPIRESNHSFYIKFENPQEFVPDTIVAVVGSVLSKTNLNSEYSVDVLQCASEEIVYGFQVFENKEENVIPCLGRSLPEDCYQIKISINKNTPVLAEFPLVIVSFIISLTLSLVLFKRKEPTVDSTVEDSIELGKFKFFYERGVMKNGDQHIELSNKETQVLKILGSNPNSTISREQLQKEVWEDEGVVVGRSLDVFISKLRKKLELDPHIRIANVHGKGYKLETVFEQV
ncbi:MAG: winged helix-turn-helix transcriptional regulator [Cyclobacteriaceae bacterium]